MNYKIAFKKAVARDLKKIEKNQADRILRKIAKELPSKAENVMVLTGKFAGLRKFRVGDYRVIYAILGDTVLILRVRHRREAYR